MTGEMKTSGEQRDVQEGLSRLEEETIEYFVSFVQILGLPRSIGQIYGLLFVAREPLAMAEIIEQLGVSKGSVSQGLTLLKSLGAISSVRKSDDRRESFEADFRVSRIVNHFISERLNPRLRSGEERLDSMIELAGKQRGDDEGVVTARLKALKKWQKRAKRVLPMVKVAMGGAKLKD